MSVWINRCHIGDCRDAMQAMIADGLRVQMCVTSPPYWGLRDYGTEPVEWPAVSFLPMPGLPAVTVPAQRASLGLEADPWAFVGHMVLVFRLVRELLAKDGTLWLNLGDCYATGAGAAGEHPGGGKQGAKWRGNGKPKTNGRGERQTNPKHVGKNTGIVAIGPMTQPNRMPIVGLKPKDLVGIPWRVAFALQADGWYLRQDIIWHKPNPMPESVRDRCTKAHEYLFLLAKSERYYFDADAIKEPLTRPEEGLRKTPAKFGGANKYEEAKKQSRLHSGNGYLGTPTGKRNRRSVWTIVTEAFSGASICGSGRTVSPDCPVHGVRSYLESKAERDARQGASPSGHSQRSDDHPDLWRQDALAPTLMHGAVDSFHGSSDLLVRAYEQTAIDHSSESRRTGLAQSILRHGKCDEESGYRIERSELRSDLDANDARIRGSNTVADCAADVMGSGHEGQTHAHSVCTCTRGEIIDHFATFPQALVEPCILAGSRSGDVVLDPFMGSGTTGKVALRLGRKYVGCELSAAYGELQEDRLRGTTIGFEFPTNEGGSDEREVELRP